MTQEQFFEDLSVELAASMAEVDSAESTPENWQLVESALTEVLAKYTGSGKPFVDSAVFCDGTMNRLQKDIDWDCDIPMINAEVYVKFYDAEAGETTALLQLTAVEGEDDLEQLLVVLSQDNVMEGEETDGKVCLD